MNAMLWAPAVALSSLGSGCAGKQLFTTEKALEAITPDSGEGRAGPGALDARLRRLARTVRLMNAAVQKLEDAVRATGALRRNGKNVEIDHAESTCDARRLRGAGDA
jgi:hypothetical protein